MPTVRLTFEPWREVFVSEDEYLRLLRQGLIFTGATPPPPPAFTDPQYAELANPDGEAAQRIIEAVGASEIISGVTTEVAATFEPRFDAVELTASTAQSSASSALDGVNSLNLLTTTGRLSESYLRYQAGQYVLSTAADNTDTGLQDAMTAAIALGIRRLSVLSRDAFGATEWTFPKTVTIPAGFELDMSQARTVHPDFPNPGFYIPFASPCVKLILGRHRRGGGRRAMADYPTGTYYGANSRASNSMVLCYADNTTITGGFVEDVSTDWRNGLRFSNGGPGGNTSLRVGNTVDMYRHPNIDMPLLAVGQRGFLVRSIQGTYSPLTDTDDPPHQIYLTATSTGQRSIGTHIMSAQTWNGVGGCAWSIKGQDMITIGSLTADACPGGLQVFDVTGSVMIDTLHVTNIYTDPTGGGMIEGLRSNGSTSDPSLHANKMLGEARITHAPSVTAANIRAMSLDEYWKISTIEHEYTTNEVVDSQSSINISGDWTDIDTVRIRNLGTGGIRGIRYSSGTRHVLRTAPSIDGAATAIQIDSGVSTSTIRFDPTLIRTVTNPATSKPFAKIAYPRNTGVLVRGTEGRYNFSSGDQVAMPKASSLADISLSSGLLYLQQVEDVADSFSTNAFVVNVRGGGAGITLRVGLFTGPNASGAHSLIVDLGTVATTATGEATSATIATPGVVTPDSWWGIVAQGGSASARGALGPVQSIITTNTANVVGALIRVASGVTGALPSTVTPTAAGDANSGYVRVAFKVA